MRLAPVILLLWVLTMGAWAEVTVVRLIRVPKEPPSNSNVNVKVVVGSSYSKTNGIIRKTPDDLPGMPQEIVWRLDGELYRADRESVHPLTRQEVAQLSELLLSPCDAEAMLDQLGVTQARLEALSQGLERLLGEPLAPSDLK